MIKITLTNDILKAISEVDENRFSFRNIALSPMTKNRLRKNSKKKEKELIKFLLKKRLYEFTPIEVSKMLEVTNKTIINRCANLCK